MASGTSKGVVRSEPGDPVEREGRPSQWLHCELKKEQRRVVASCAVEVDLTARRAAMHQDPFAVASHRDGDRLHRGAARRVAVTGHVVIEVAAPQARGAVVAMGGAGRVEGHVEVAASTAEGARGGSSAGVMPVGQAV
jgi:hypothetical protein